MYTQLLIDRLSVRSMLPKRHGGIGEGYSKIMAIDAGNSSDVYQFVDFARQYGLEIKKVLQNIFVSRVFTIYQLAHHVIDELPLIIEQLSADKGRNYVIVIYGLLHLFVSDPHIDKADAKQLKKEISSSMKKLSEDRLGLVSSTHCSSKYEKSLFSSFDNTIEITNDAKDYRILQIKISDKCLGKLFNQTLSPKKRRS